MESSNQDINVLSMIKDIKADLDSKTADIAEIKDSVNLLKNILLSTVTNSVDRGRQMHFQDENKVAFHQPPTLEDQGVDNISSVGTSLTKVSRSDSSRDMYLPGYLGKYPDPLVAAASASTNDNDDSANHIDPAWFDSKTIIPPKRVMSVPDTENTVSRPPSARDTISNHDHWQRRQFGQAIAPESVGICHDPQEFMTNVMVNGVPRSIPSALKVSASKKQPMGQRRETLGPSQPFVFTRTIRASAPAKFPGWHGGAPVPFPQADLASKHHSRPTGDGKRGSESHGLRKFRPKHCTICGEGTHHYKDCPKKSTKHERFDKQRLGSEAGDSSDKSSTRPSANGKGPICRPSEKAPGYPMDRQLELINTIIVRLEEAEQKATTDIVISPGDNFMEGVVEQAN
ncbi:hypothetical protein H072_10424 [Dactylellina haptotyla CBS 200.50]|uniref:Uncharacterized protein n=1 Tax=Dactylellina haptotyla (strain CBS 200.50) TaxID=1284197 RepID=S7ZZY1_DACHA|nr:hypothetical protein H072_10424 [Dactylellina haptotyla CBS 200.50]